MLVKQLQSSLLTIEKEANTSILQEAFEVSSKYLATKKRRTGETYQQHTLEVAYVLSELTQDPYLLRVAILHDMPLIDDYEQILQTLDFSSSDFELIESMHQLRRLHIDESIQDLDIVLHAISEDPRLLPLRMAHRLTDVRRLEKFDQNIRKAIAKETLHMYAAIAGRLGMHEWRREMEDICFVSIHPTIAKSIKNQFKDYKRIDDVCIERATSFLKKEMISRGISCDILHRVKSLYSTYRKMILKDRKFSELTDRLAIRLIVDDIESCYLALGIVHEIMNPVPGKIKDYIGAPKENGYRSIHTVVYPLTGVTQQPMEIQIRTSEMDRECEYGVTAGITHSDYKNYQYAISTSKTRVNLFRNLEHLRQDASNLQEFENAIRTYFSSDHMLIFDSENHMYHIKKPATALDFVGVSHPSKIKKLKLVKINGRISTIHNLLSDGDTVEVKFGRKNILPDGGLQDCLYESTRKLLQI